MPIGIAHGEATVTASFRPDRSATLVTLEARRHGDRWVIAGDTSELGTDDLAAIVDALTTELDTDGSAGVDWWVDPADERSDQVAARAGFAPDRDIDQLRRPLPVDLPFTIETRAFDPATDAEGWLDVNNRAFSWHEEQGGWTADDLRGRMEEPWFDAGDFRIHETDGAIDGFCWTKVYADTNPLIGEIFVIAVDPDMAGRGLGRQLTLAGLDHLNRRRGAAIGMLYVESDNDAAQGLYRGLGFTRHQVNRRYRRG